MKEKCSLKNFCKKNNNVYLLFFILVCLLASMAFKLSGMSGNDFWWHVKSGEWIVNNKTVPTKALFTWYGESNSLNWFAHEWLWEVIIYGIFHSFGTLGMFQFCLYMGMIIIALAIIYNREYVFENVTLSSIYMLYFVLVITQFFYGRPHTINMTLLFVLLYILYKYKEKDTKLIYALPFLSVFWVNVHGGSSNLIYIMPIIFIVGGCFSFEYGKLKSTKYEKRRMIKLTGITTLSSLLLLVNPRGVDMVLYPFTNMADKAMLEFLSEWKNPDIKDLSKLFLCFVPVILVTVVMMLTTKKIELTDFLLYGFYTYMFFRSQRFISLFMIASSFYFFRYLIPFGEKKKTETKVNEQQNKVVVVAASLFFVISLVFQMGYSANYQKKHQLIDNIIPKEFVDIIKEDNPKRLCNDYTCGGPLIYHDIKVFIDGRADIYTGSTFKNYQTMKYCRNYNPEELSNENYMETLLDMYKFDAFLVENKVPLYHYLCQNPDKYEKKLSDDEYSYFIVK